MKKSFLAIVAIAGLLCAFTVTAQEKKEEKKRKKHVISLGMDGLKITAKDTAHGVSVNDERKDEDEDSKRKSRFKMNVMLLDLGINVLQDNTDYTQPAVKTFLNVPANEQNKSLFNLRPGKSINVNIYPWMVKFAAVRTKNQRMYISTGVGLQLYNFRYESPITYTKNPSGVIMDTISFKKNKLGLDYLNVPLMITFKTRLHKDNWLVYGVGITAGYRIASWQKQVSGPRGKVKVHDAFGLADFNSCLTGEFGVDGVIRFYATYQLTSLYQNGLDQHPFSFGIRFSGI